MRRQSRSLLLCFSTALALVAGTFSSAAPLVEYPNPYGNAFENKFTQVSLFAQQRVFPGVGFGAGNPFDANPNKNLVFDGGFGVRYTSDSGTKVDFGVGLYLDSFSSLISTSLGVGYYEGTIASETTLTLGNFGLNSSSTSFDPLKVAPVINIQAYPTSYSFSPDQIFPLMQFQGTIPDNINGNPVDLWTLNLGDLLNSIGVNRDLWIGGVSFAADAFLNQDTEVGVGNPYFFAGTTFSVPEPSSAVLLMGAMGAFFVRRARKVSV